MPESRPPDPRAAPGCDATASPHWPAGASVPFPVEAPFRVRADLIRLGEGDVGREAGHGDALVLADARLPIYQALKTRHLADARRPLVMIAPDADRGRLREALCAVLRRLAHRHPEVVAPWRDERGTAAGWTIAAIGLRIEACGMRVQALNPRARDLLGPLEALEPVARSLAVLSLGVQEDLVLMGRSGSDADADADAEANGLRALALSVVFPSGWEPAARLNQSLCEIHRPVADGQRLRQASAALSRAMIDKGPFERHVWTIAADARLARWPGEPSPAAPSPPAGQGSDTLADLWFRCERQVLLGLPEQQASLFLIRVMLEPLARVASTPMRRERLLASLGSMSDAVIAYKGLRALRDRIAAAWAPA